MTNETKNIIIDAKGQPFGRVASRVAALLQGKADPRYHRNLNIGPIVKIENLNEIRFTGKKLSKKLYRWHTGYIGHLKEDTLKNLWRKDPRRVFKKAVAGMLPKNKLRAKRLARLMISL